jgi:hypothetical protein
MFRFINARLMPGLVPSRETTAVPRPSHRKIARRRRRQTVARTGRFPAVRSASRRERGHRRSGPRAAWPAAVRRPRKNRRGNLPARKLLKTTNPAKLSLARASGSTHPKFSSLKKSAPLSSITMNAGKSSTSMRQIASIPSSGYSSTSTFLMQSCASRAAGPPIEPR